MAWRRSSSPSATSRRPSSAARCTSSRILTITASTFEAGGKLKHSHEHSGRDVAERIRRPEILSIQARGEYLYAACGESGLRVFDIAFIDHKGFSERIVTAPVSPLGQRFFVRTSLRHRGRSPGDDGAGPDTTASARQQRAERARDVRLSLRHGPG